MLEVEVRQSHTGYAALVNIQVACRDVMLRDERLLSFDDFVDTKVRMERSFDVAEGDQGAISSSTTVASSQYQIA